MDLKMHEYWKKQQAVAYKGESMKYFQSCSHVLSLHVFARIQACMCI